VLRTSLNSFQVIKCPDEDCNAELDTISPYFEKLKEVDRKKLLKIRRNREVLSNP
jgi:hypothetical protein